MAAKLVHDIQIVYVSAVAIYPSRGLRADSEIGNFAVVELVAESVLHFD